MGALALMMAAVFAAAFLRGLSGFGFALAAVPILSMVVPPLQAVIIVQLLQVAVAPMDLWHNHRLIDKKALGLLFTGALLVAPLGGYFATRLDPDLMRILVAVFVLLGLLAIVKNLRISPGAGPAIVAGSLSGLLAGLAAMPGPPAVAFFLGRGDDKAVSRASLLAFFAATAAVVLISMLVTSDAVELSLVKTAALSIPALLLGTSLGAAVFKRLGDGGYRKVALAILLLSALMSGVKGLQGFL